MEVRSHFFKKWRNFYSNSILDREKMEFLGKMCEKLKLNEEQEVHINISLDNNQRLNWRGERCLVKKIIIDLVIKRKIVYKIMMKL